MRDAAAVLALYLGLQASYLFGYAGAIAAGLVTLALGRSREGVIAQGIRLVAIALIVECAVLGASAFHRVIYYGDAYGHTIQRLLVQIYTVAAVIGLGILARELRGALDARRQALMRWTLAARRPACSMSTGAFANATPGMCP